MHLPGVFRIKKVMRRALGKSLQNRLIRITPDEAAATSEMFDLLLGDNLSGRKEYIAEHGADYLELADIS